MFFLVDISLRIYGPICSYESIKVKMEYWDKKHLLETGPVPLMVFYYVFNTLLYCLQILHIYWWILICRVLISQIRAKGKIAKDIRSGQILYMHTYLTQQLRIIFFVKLYIINTRICLSLSVFNSSLQILKVKMMNTKIDFVDVQSNFSISDVNLINKKSSLFYVWFL